MIITTRCLKITQKGPINIGIAPKLRSSLRSQSYKMRHFVVICKHCELQEFIDVLENKSQWIFNYVSTIRDMQILINSVSVSRTLRILFLPKVFHCREELILARARHWLIYRLLKLTWLNQIHCYSVLQEILLHKKVDAPSFFRASCASPCLPLSCCSSRLK